MITKESQQSVNLGETEIINFKVVEKYPPNSPFAKLSNSTGVQTTPQLARGYLPGSSIELLNNNLNHVCDFKFIFNIQGDFGLGLLNPVTALQKAIKNAKLRATNRLRNLIQNAIGQFRQAIDAILKALGFDPSGQISVYWSLGKKILRDINRIIELAAEAVEVVLEWVFFAQQIKQLVDWILSLPEKIKNLLANCIKSFTNSIKEIAQNVQSIPEQIVNLTKAQASSIANEFSSAGNLLVSSLKEQQSGLPPAVASSLSLSTSDPNHLTTINNYISAVASANSVTSNTTSYQMSTMQSP